MKRWICILLAVLMAVLCSSCGKEKNSETTTAGAATTTVTIPEGKTVYQIAKILEQHEVCSADDFINAVNASDSEIARTLSGGNRAFLLEGYVFPDTYEFYKNSSGASALSKFLNNINVRVTDAHKARAAELGFTMDEIITLASVIQYEAGAVSEMKKVSSVLHNRLKKGMKLQCDATYFYLRDSVMPYYCGEDWDDAVYEKYANEYYTYRIPALPTGPICNPGLAAIEAALYPENTDYLFFFSDGNGDYHCRCASNVRDGVEARPFLYPNWWWLRRFERLFDG